MAANGTPLADLFNTVQLAASGAQISVTSLANDAAGLPQTVRRRDILNAYPYTNTLTILQITGAVLRRAMERRESEFFSIRAMDIATLNPKTIGPDEKLIAAEKKMTQHKINSLLVTDDEGKLVGVIQIYDIKL